MDRRRRVIDAHVHIWDLPDTLESPLPNQSATVETLLSDMHAAGVERAVLVQPSIYRDDHTYLRAAVNAHPECFAAVALSDPFSPRAWPNLDDLAETLRLRGVRLRLKDHAADEACESPEVRVLLDRIERRSITLSVLTSPHGLDGIARIARQHPDLRIVVDHLGSPDRSAFSGKTHGRLLNPLRQTPNVWLKLSGFYSFSSETYPYLDCEPLVRDILDSFGADRLVWGSDFPFAYRTNAYAECVTQLDRLLPDLSDSEADRLLFNNAFALWW